MHIARRVDGQRGGLVVAFDGYIDNASELIAECGMSASLSPAELVGALYMRSGSAALDRLAGEFRCLVHDEADGTLMAFVDIACTKRIWWRESDNVVIVASAVGRLYKHSDSLRINHDYLVERLACGWNSGRASPFEGASRLLPGECLHLSPTSLSVRKYWCPTTFLAADATVRSESDCVAEFAELLREAVERRLPKDGGFLCDLSGGLDSTTVTTLAGQLVGPNAARHLHALTAAYADAPRTDERLFASTVAQAAGARHHILERRASEPLFDGMPENAHYWDEPRFNVYSHSMAVAKHKLLRSIGASVVLSGAGAEAALCEHIAWPVFLADFLVHGRWRELRDGLKRWQGARRAPFPVLFYRSCLAPLLSPVSAMTYEERLVVPPWLTDVTKRRFEELAMERDRPVIRRRNTAGAWMAEQWQGSASVSEQGYSAYAYETRFPFLHRRLVEGVLKMPWAIRASPHQNKPLLRRLAQDLLPPGFATRVSLGADQAVSRALATQQHRLAQIASPSVLAQLGLIDEGKLTASLALAQQGFGGGLRFTVTVLAAELWMRSVLRGEWHRAQLSEPAGLVTQMSV